MMKVSNETSQTLQQPCQNLLKMQEAAHVFHRDQYKLSLNDCHIISCLYQNPRSTGESSFSVFVLSVSCGAQPLTALSDILQSLLRAQLRLTNAEENAKTPKAH